MVWALAWLFGLGAREAFGLDEIEEMLVRARSGSTSTARDRELASELLEEWRDSERVGRTPGDPGIARALEAVSAGRSLTTAEAAAAARMEESYRLSREGLLARSSAGRPFGPGAPPLPAGAGSGGRWIADGSAWVVLAAGAGVLAIGAAWIAARRMLRRG